VQPPLLHCTHKLLHNIIRYCYDYVLRCCCITLGRIRRRWTGGGFGIDFPQRANTHIIIYASVYSGCCTPRTDRVNHRSIVVVCNINRVCLKFRTLQRKPGQSDLNNNRLCGAVHSMHAPSRVQRYKWEKWNISRRDLVINNSTAWLDTIFAVKYCRRLVLRKRDLIKVDVHPATSAQYEPKQKRNNHLAINLPIAFDRTLGYKTIPQICNIFWKIKFFRGRLW